jgi:lipopolysaccharide biosynthesis protein
LTKDTCPEAFRIFVHVFYPKIWEEMVADLEAIIRQPFDLVITRPAGSRAAARPASAYLGTTTEFEVDNRGRDILPFLNALASQSAWKSDIGLKLHTKHSPHRSDGDAWRRFLLASLLETRNDYGLSGPALLRREPLVGLVAPEAHLLPLGGRTSINENILQDTLLRVNGSGAEMSDLEGSLFPAGSMFWFRRAALRRVIETEFGELFVRENGQLDGTAAHAFERLFAFFIAQEGYVAAAMEHVEPIFCSGEGPLPQGELLALIGENISKNNPFTLPVAEFWRRHPRLLRLAHTLYARLPKSAVRMLRGSVGR